MDISIPFPFSNVFQYYNMSRTDNFHGVGVFDKPLNSLEEHIPAAVYLCLLGLRGIHIGRGYVDLELQRSAR